jgi:hypothetical protein
LIDRLRGRVEEILVEELRPADDQKDDADGEDERARDLRNVTEARLNQRVNDPSATRPKTIVNPAMKLVETSSSVDWSRRRSPSSTARWNISDGFGAIDTCLAMRVERIRVPSP